MPPSGVHDIPLSSESVDAALQLLPHPLLDNLPQVLPHEVCVCISGFVFVCAYARARAHTRTHVYTFLLLCHMHFFCCVICIGIYVCLHACMHASGYLPHFGM